MYGTPSERDGRIQTVDYNEQDVFNVRVKAGAQTTIKFGQDETIKDVGIGDPEAGQYRSGTTLCFCVQKQKNRIQTLPFRPISIYILFT